MTRFSSTVSSASSWSLWGTTPSRARIRWPCVAGSSPKIRSSPSVTGETQPIIRIVDDLPAPFGPRNPNASPRRTSTSMPSTAVKSPKRLTSLRAEMRGSDMRCPTLSVGSCAMPVRLLDADRSRPRPRHQRERGARRRPDRGGRSSRTSSTSRRWRWSRRSTTDRRVVAGFCLVLPPGADYGSVNYRWFSERYDDFVYLDRVAIAPEFQGRGLGRALYDEVERRADAAWFTARGQPAPAQRRLAGVPRPPRLRRGRSAGDRLRHPRQPDGQTPPLTYPPQIP